MSFFCFFFGLIVLFGGYHNVKRLEYLRWLA